MSLYDGLGLDSKEKVQRDSKSDLVGWSSGIKLLQSQLQLKKAALTQAKREQSKKGGAILPPVVDLKSRKDEVDDLQPPILGLGPKENKNNTTLLGGDWDIRQEYDPVWPNDYEKIMRDRADREKRIRDRERGERDRERDRDRDRERDRDRDRDRDYDRDYNEEKPMRRNDRYNRRDRYDRGNRDFERGGRELDRPRAVEDDYEEDRPRRVQNAGAAIAPPPSLLESTDRRESMQIPPTPFATGSSVAARIMAKYGFKEGQGLGKKEQGMSQALQVEKTSKRGGKIIHEKDLAKEFEPDSPPEFQLPPPPPQPGSANSPVSNSQVDSITEIMKCPSKVVLLRNMVGPGEVDEELEPETKEECGKYGEVVKCMIFEIPGGNVPEEESVRIFIEFKRLESAIKAVVDLNGRYFGGRVVKAGFYDVDKFQRLELAE
ncbi:splicing factor 45-like [Uloborus diversus]|uniref:splicing factor 45-like n=1 Tax=Uloborus diversus TaxID=327109 RepID=UPI00240A6B1F|nr:splicing factor 45-like [Uloborus diversus]XP_054707803.1 splicing factor 45-like [Uloborus diversus]